MGLQLQADDGEALHGIFGAHMEAGNTALARRACADGTLKAPNHILMSAQAARDAAFYPSETATMPDGDQPRGLLLQAEDLRATAWDRHEIKLGKSVSRSRKRVRSMTPAATVAFATQGPLLSSEECAWVIQTAEAHAASHGG